jgi:transposase
VVQAPAPERLIRGGLPTEAMVAYVLVAKFAWHLPLYRQAQMLLAQGLDIKRAVLAFWVGYAAAELLSAAHINSRFSSTSAARATLGVLRNRPVVRCAMRRMTTLRPKQGCQR